MSSLSPINPISSPQKPYVPPVQPGKSGSPPDPSTGNVSVFLPGAVGLTFEALAQIKNVAARMGVSALYLLRDIIPQLAAFNDAAKEYKLTQANEQMTLGWEQFGMNLAAGGIVLGGAAAGAYSSQSAVNAGEDEINQQFKQETQVECKIDEPEVINLTANNLTSPSNAESSPIVTPSSAEDSSETITIKAQNETQAAAAANNEKSKLSFKEIAEKKDKIREDASKAGMSKSMMWNQVLSPGLKSLSDATWSVPMGMQNRNITQAEGYSSFNSGAMQTTSQLLTLLGQVTQSRETLEQGAEQSIRSIIQTASAA